MDQVVKWIVGGAPLASLAPPPLVVQLVVRCELSVWWELVGRYDQVNLVVRWELVVKSVRTCVRACVRQVGTKRKV